jgi:pimeloyl-ACP methyl ester carboxylesterase
MFARTPEADRQHAKDLDEQSMRGESSEAEALEGLRLVWPAYFADPANAPPMPPFRLSVPASALWPEIERELPALEKALPGVRVPLGVLVGARSPMPPQQAGLASAERVPGAWAMSVPDAGHFPWVEAPGCVADAMKRLADGGRSRHVE